MIDEYSIIDMPFNLNKRGSSVIFGSSSQQLLTTYYKYEVEFKDGYTDYSNINVIVQSKYYVITSGAIKKTLNDKNHLFNVISPKNTYVSNEPIILVYYIDNDSKVISLMVSAGSTSYL